MSNTMRRRRGLVLPAAVLLVALLVAGCGGDGGAGGGAEARQKVSLRLDFGFTGYHAPFFLAQERGYYSDAGLDVTIRPGTGSGDTIKLVGAGQETFGFASLTVMTLAATKDQVPVRSVAGVIQKIPDAVFSRADRNITKPKDLEGKTWGHTPGSSGELAFPALAEQTGVDISKIRRVNMPVNAKLQAMINGRVDWITTFSFTQTAVLDKQGVDHNLILFADYLDILGHGLIVKSDMVQSQADTVRKFVGASMRGLEEALADPAAGVQAMTKARPELRENADVLTKQVTNMRDFVHTERSQGKPLGWVAPEDWQSTVDFLRKYLDMGPANVNDLYTNDFLAAS
jgi:NitT/TauT family transport system substrate-binding protein